MENLLKVKELKTSFQTLRGEVAAVDGITFEVKKGEILGIVGESGCGKSVTSQSIMRLYNEKELVKYEGEVLLEGNNLLKLSEKEMRSVRGNDIAMIFQDALSSLNPVFTIGNQIVEAIRLHEKISKKEAKKRAVELLRLTGIPIPEKRVDAYPHELSGGMRQRAMIALALSCQPKLLIADEPTTALDVTIQAQIMDLIVELNQKMGMGIMLITHDLGVVAHTCQRVIVMYLGQIVEEGMVDEIFKNPSHPYTKGLIKSVPTTNTDVSRKLYTIKGVVPLLSEAGEGCRFCNRCEMATEKCRTSKPHLYSMKNEGHRVRCFLYEKGGDCHEAK